MLHPTVFNTAQVCHQLGVMHAVMSPGSRNAPLTISFARHNEIKKWIIPDERSAGFIALGIADHTQSPVVLCCTSGSALLNYAPAIAEAYYREIPLIVLSADRPPEMIDQRDGQTIRQFEALKNHVKQSYALPVITTEKDAKVYESNLIEAIRASETLPKGPVHINVPFREPLYPEKDQKLHYQPIEIPPSGQLESKKQSFNLADFKKPLILIGQQDSNAELDHVLSSISNRIPVLKFPLNNLKEGVEHVDSFIRDQAALRPDLLITSGLSVLSKNLKIYLRKYPPLKHLHFDPSGVVVDTYGTKPELVKQSLASFLSNAAFNLADRNYLDTWKSISNKVKSKIETHINQADFSESKAAYVCLTSLPDEIGLHLSNSMPVRYAELFGVKNTVISTSNRGTSGIDGCTSTAVGHALVSNKIHVLLTGDLAFLYDRNAFFHNYQLANLRIIVLNNQGGGIFRLIDGPTQLPELEEYFETRHNRTARYICEENHLEYLKADSDDSLRDQLKAFYSPSSTAKVLEIFTEPAINQQVYNDLKKEINEQVND